jgi:hypothetical protein
LHEISLASPGFGASANSFLDFVNVNEGNVYFGVLNENENKQFNEANKNGIDANEYNNEYICNGSSALHRSKDSGSGGFTPYHSRRAAARQEIKPYQELFVSYGDNWFLDRQHRIGTIPVTGDHKLAETLYKRFYMKFLGGKQRKRKHKLKGIRTNNANNTNKNKRKQLNIEFKRKSNNKRNVQIQTQTLKNDHDEYGVDENELELRKLYKEFWNTVILEEIRNDIWTKSRVLAALPSPYSKEYDELVSAFDNNRNKKNQDKQDYIKIKQKKMIRSPEWLNKHGVCADSIRIGISTIENKQAGHGAFTNTHFNAGDVIMSVPLIHIPNRTILDTYYIYDYGGNTKSGGEDSTTAEDEKKKDDESENNENEKDEYELQIGNEPTGHQLLLNYVLGHRDSTMLLSPYGPGFQLINHNQTLVNCKLQWASMDRSNHHPHLLKQSVEYIKTNHSTGSVLALEVVATKSIGKNDELFLNYGNEWEIAWNNHHNTNWYPVHGSNSYVSAIELNTQSIYEPLKEWKENENENENENEDEDENENENENENEEDSNHKKSSKSKSSKSPYPNNVRLMFNLAWADIEHRIEYGDDSIDHYMMWEHYRYVQVAFIYPTPAATSSTNGMRRSIPTAPVIVDDGQNNELWEQLTEEEKQKVLSHQQITNGGQQHNKPKPKMMNGKLIDQTLYTVVIAADEDDEDGDGEQRIIKNVPRRGLQFEDIAYTNDQFLYNAFRHDIRIPDDIFPEVWKNNKQQNNSNNKSKSIIITQEQQRQRSYSQLLQQQQQLQQKRHQETIDKEKKEEEDTYEEDHHHEVTEEDEDDDDDNELPSASDF